jgi:hypothetical protein
MPSASLAEPSTRYATANNRPRTASKAGDDGTAGRSRVADVGGVLAPTGAGLLHEREIVPHDGPPPVAPARVGPMAAQWVRGR